MNEFVSHPWVLVLCTDERLARLLGNELHYMGMDSRTETCIPDTTEDLCLLVADGDVFPLKDCERLALACGCPLLVFGRTLSDPATASNVSFLRRPFALTELEQLISTLLDRGVPVRYERMASSKSGELPHASPFAPVLVLDGDTVTIGDRRISLTSAEKDILTCLLSHSGQTVPRSTLASLLEGGGNSVDVYVCRLRAKIEKPLGRRMIVTVRGVGYCLNG